MWVCQVVSKGVIVSFLGGFEGSVGLRHLPSCEATPTSLQPRKKVRGRLLWVDVEEKKVGVSLQRTLVEGRSHTFQGVEFGDTFESERSHTHTHNVTLICPQVHRSLKYFLTPPSC